MTRNPYVWRTLGVRNPYVGRTLGVRHWCYGRTLVARIPYGGRVSGSLSPNPNRHDKLWEINYLRGEHWGQWSPFLCLRSVVLVGVALPSRCYSWCGVADRFQPGDGVFVVTVADAANVGIATDVLLGVAQAEICKGG